jgi:mono/diheme cytochrome c family protein
MQRTFFQGTLSILLLAITVMSPLSDSRAQTTPTDRLSRISGLLLASREASEGSVSLYIATQYGLLRARPDGMASLVPGLEAGLTSLAVNPENPRMMLTSGYAPDGNKLGVMMSPDGGESWTRISDGANGPVAFQAIAISHADPEIVYAVANELQISRDAGRTWKSGGKLPADVFGLAASSVKVGALYIATKGGLLFSRDDGVSWKPAYAAPRPATMVRAAPGGRLYAFVYGIGLITTQEPGLAWETLSRDFADRYILDLALDPGDPKRLYATVDTGAIMTSGDGGKSWTSFEGSHRATAANIARGKQLYEDNCQACHGVGGIGESPGDPSARDEYGFKAPALNDDAHGWHHSDKNLSATVLNGSSRNERMVAFKETLSDEDVDNVIAYVKSLWSFRSLACQGARHMSCMGR